MALVGAGPDGDGSEAGGRAAFARKHQAIRNHGGRNTAVFEQRFCFPVRPPCGGIDMFAKNLAEFPIHLAGGGVRSCDAMVGEDRGSVGFVPDKRRS
jgi:hypothetical protein